MFHLLNQSHVSDEIEVPGITGFMDFGQRSVF
jgi:hypothetical protein